MLQLLAIALLLWYLKGCPSTRSQGFLVERLATPCHGMNSEFDTCTKDVNSRVSRLVSFAERNNKVLPSLATIRRFDETLVFTRLRIANLYRVLIVNLPMLGPWSKELPKSP